MSGHDQEPTPVIPELDWRTQRALGSYAVLKESLDNVALAVADEAVDAINRGLPEGVMVGTFTSTMPVKGEYGIGGYNTIYRPEGPTDPAYVPYAEICTEGKTSPFLGHRLARIEDELVVINDDEEIGLSTKNRVFVVDTHDDPHTGSMGGSYQDQFLGSVLPQVQHIAQGGRAFFRDIWS